MKLRIGNKQLMKDINRLLVLNEIRKNAPVSRTDIARNLKLGQSTVTNIIEELKSNGFVFENGEADSTGGRKPIMLDFNYYYGYTIGIKIAEDCIILVLTNLKVEVIHRAKVNFKRNSNSMSVLKILVTQINMLKQKIPEEKKLLGIGIAISGLVDQEKGQLIYSGMLNWQGTDISGELYEVFKVPVFIDNNVNAYTLAELWQGYGKSLKDFVVVTYGIGIGCGIVINGKLYRGNFGGAGELGHMIINVDGRKCECGQNGCLEAYCSEKFVIEYIKENKAFYKNSIIDFSKELTISKVYEYATRGDTLALNSLKISSQNFAYGLLNVVNLLNPSTIIIAGEGTVAQDIFLPIVEEIVKDNFFKMHRKKITVVISKLGDEAWEIGASILVVSKLFEMPLYEGQNTLFIQ